MTITMITRKMELKAGTKTVYKEIDKTETIINEEKYKNIVAGKKFFRKVGCKEWHLKEYTKAGYTVTKIITTYPDRKNKIERIFLFT